MHRLPLLLCAVVLSLQALAQEMPPPPGFHEHDGFFLSLSSGPVYASIEDDAGSLKLTYSGWGASFDLRIGGAVATNLVLSGDIMGWSLTSPKVESSGYIYGTLSSVNFIQSTFGAGITYFFMPVNIFISGTVGLAGFTLDGQGDTATTDKGLGIYVKAGKDWWVGANWGIGVAGSVGWSSVKNSTSSGSETLAGFSFTVQFNATFQ